MIPASDVQESHGTVMVPREPTLSRRVAAAVVGMAQRFQSDILFTFGDIHIDAKSTLMAYILLDALKGRRVEVMARGSDSALAVRDLSALFRDKELSHEAAYRLTRDRPVHRLRAFHGRARY